MKLKKAIIDSGVVSVFQHVVSPSSSSDKKANPEIAVEAFQTFSNYYRNFDKTDKEILSIFGLDGIESTKIWTRILAGDNGTSREVYIKYYRGLTFIRDYLDKLPDLLK
ncbi:hypothetical protein ACAW74_16665 [Fibrella sp. WM1]|uniref:hypothetical protein n=1 Tax=Fibrella musci TaxID=3242485 RepID=UPI003522CC47